MFETNPVCLFSFYIPLFCSWRDVSRLKVRFNSHQPTLHTTHSQDSSSLSQLSKGRKSSNSTCHRRDCSSNNTSQQKSADTPSYVTSDYLFNEESPFFSRDMTYYLQGIGGQFEGTCKIEPSSSQRPAVEGVSTCSYHEAVLDGRTKHQRADNEPDTMGLYTSADPEVQYALFYRSENGCLSTRMNCTCFSTDRLQIEWRTGMPGVSWYIGVPLLSSKAVLTLNQKLFPYLPDPYPWYQPLANLNLR